MKPGRMAARGPARKRSGGGRWRASRRSERLGPMVWLLGALLVAACFGVMELLYRV